MKSRRLFIEISLVTFTIFILLWIFVPKFITSQNINLPKYFPDPVIRNAVRLVMGVKGDEPFSKKQASQYNGDLVIENCENLKGIEFFSNITILSLECHTITDMNLSMYPNLEEVILNCDNINSVNTDNNSHLKEFTLQIYPSKRTNTSPVDVQFTQNHKLYYLSLINCPLNSVDVTANPELFNLSVYSGNSKHHLRKLDISQNTKLATLFLSGHDLETLDVSHLQDLNILRCSQNHLKEIKLPTSTNITHFECSQNDLTELDVSTLQKLEIFSCYQNQLTELILPKTISALTYLRCYENKLETLDLSKQIFLKTLQAQKNPIKHISFSKYPIQWIETDNFEWNRYAIPKEESWPMGFVSYRKPASKQKRNDNFSKRSKLIKIISPVPENISKESKRNPFVNEFAQHLHPEVKLLNPDIESEKSIIEQDLIIEFEPELSPNLLNKSIE